jgi:hypothetical protein
LSAAFSTAAGERKKPGFYRRRRAKKAGLEADKDATEAAETSSAGDDMSQDSP